MCHTFAVIATTAAALILIPDLGLDMCTTIAYHIIIPKYTFAFPSYILPFSISEHCRHFAQETFTIYNTATIQQQ